VKADHRALLAAVRLRGRITLVAELGSTISEGRDSVAAVVAWASDEDVSLSDTCANRALARVQAWIDRRRALELLDAGSTSAGRARRRLLARIDAISERAPRHLRPQLLDLARDARRAATEVFGIAVERVLEHLAQSPLPDAAWLTAVRNFTEVSRRAGARSEESWAILAVLVLVGP